MKALYKADAITKYKKPVNKQVTDMTLGQSASEMMYVTNKNKGLIICFKNGTTMLLRSQSSTYVTKTGS